MKNENTQKFLALLLALIIPAVALFSVCVMVPAQYGRTFLGALAPKYERLTSIEEPKVVLVGGSSTAFGLDSALLEQQFGMPVVNFGLYATLGTKVMLDLSRAGINAGDIIILAPEVDAQTLSLYFNAESTWQAVEGKPSMLLRVGFDNWGAMLGAFFGYVGDKIAFWQDGTPDPDGVYNARNFNDRGDIVYDRPHNTMLLGYDPNMTIDLSPEIVDDEFIDYVNDYIADARAKGATVYWSFPPMNEDALAADTTDDSIFAFFHYLASNLDCPVISNPHDYIYEANYFYDTNFHLNDAGVVLRTAALVADLRRMQGDARPVEIELPEAPERPAPETPSVSAGDAVDMSAYFTYSDMAGGLMVTGVTAEGKGLASLTVPTTANGKAVVAIGENAFAGCTALKEIVVYANVIQFYDGCYRGASALERVVMHYEVATGVGVGEKLFDGAPEGATLYFPTQESFTNFVADYYWSLYGPRMDILG